MTAETYWPVRTEQQQRAWARRCANFYEDRIFICGEEGMKIVSKGPEEITIECYGPSVERFNRECSARGLTPLKTWTAGIPDQNTRNTRLFLLKPL